MEIIFSPFCVREKWLVWKPMDLRDRDMGLSSFFMELLSLKFEPKFLK